MVHFYHETQCLRSDNLLTSGLKTMIKVAKKMNKMDSTEERKKFAKKKFHLISHAL